MVLTKNWGYGELERKRREDMWKGACKPYFIFLETTFRYRCFYLQIAVVFFASHLKFFRRLWGIRVKVLVPIKAQCICVLDILASIWKLEVLYRHLFLCICMLYVLHLCVLCTKINFVLVANQSSLLAIFWKLLLSIFFDKEKDHVSFAVHVSWCKRS